jgi:uncharacterized lipoprotein NlpE involved in copper resistance
MKKIIYPLLVFCITSLVGCNTNGKEKTFNGVQLFYTSEITEAEADKLGAFLIDSEFADGEDKTVQITKNGNTYEFRMAVKKGLENDQEFAPIFKQFAADISKNVFNNVQVDLHACDEYLNTLRVYIMAD